MDGAPRTVLVLEDDAAVRHLVARVLQEKGFDVTSTGEPREALELLERTRFDALLVDKNLRGQSGLDVAKKAREWWSDLPVVLMTAYPEAGILSKVPLDGYLAKPFRNILDVPAAIEGAIERRLRLRQANDLESAMTRVRVQLGNTGP